MKNYDKIHPVWWALIRQREFHGFKVDVHRIDLSTLSTSIESFLKDCSFIWGQRYVTVQKRRGKKDLGNRTGERLVLTLKENLYCTVWKCRILDWCCLLIWWNQQHCPPCWVEPSRFLKGLIYESRDSASWGGSTLISSASSRDSSVSSLISSSSSSSSSSSLAISWRASLMLSPSL